MADTFKCSVNPVNKINAIQHIHPQQAKVLQMQKEYAESAFDTSAGTYEEMRAAYNEERKMWNTGGPIMLESKTVAIPTRHGNIDTLISKAVDGDCLPVIFYIHGGGFVVGSVHTHELIQKKLSAYSSAVVIGIDYTLTPESVYPQGIEECADVVSYYVEHAKEFGLDVNQISFGGDSGGANMAMGVTMYLRDCGFDVKRIKAELLFYGTYGLAQSISSALHGGAWDGLSEQDCAYYFGMYLGGKNPKDCPYYNILLNDLTHDVPPCFMVAGDLDPLKDDSILLHNILRDKGIESEYHEYKGILHAFVVYSNVMDDAEDAIKKAAEFLKKHLA